MRLNSKGDFDIVHSAIMGIVLDAYLRKFMVSSQAVPILRQINHTSVT